MSDDQFDKELIGNLQEKLAESERERDGEKFMRSADQIVIKNLESKILALEKELEDAKNRPALLLKIQWQRQKILSLEASRDAMRKYVLHTFECHTRPDNCEHSPYCNACTCGLSAALDGEG